jgi:hypothetical protein
MALGVSLNLFIFWVSFSLCYLMDYGPTVTFCLLVQSGAVFRRISSHMHLLWLWLQCDGYEESVSRFSFKLYYLLSPWQYMDGRVPCRGGIQTPCSRTPRS